VERHIKENADTLDRVENKQIVVVERLDNFEKSLGSREGNGGEVPDNQRVSPSGDQELPVVQDAEGFHPPELPKYGK